MRNPHAIGTFAWMQASHGRLNWQERLHLLSRIMMPSLSAMCRTWTGLGLRLPLDLDAMVLPHTAAVRHALTQAEAVVSPCVLQHSMRTYIWAAALARVDDVAFDAEFLLVASLLHDLGTAPGMDRPGCDCFAGQSAYAARDSMRGFGWDMPVTDRLANAISLHMNGHMPWTTGMDSEAYLLQQGAALDVIGARWHDLHAGFKHQVMRRHPRSGFDREFADFIASERRRRPDSRAALMHLAGLTVMMKMNPFKD